MGLDRFVQALLEGGRGLHLDLQLLRCVLEPPSKRLQWVKL